MQTRAAVAFLPKQPLEIANGRTDVTKLVDRDVNGMIEIDSMITHVLPLEGSNNAFDPMHAGESLWPVVVV